MLFDITSSVELTCEELDDLTVDTLEFDDGSDVEPPIDSWMRFFETNHDVEEDDWTISHQYPCAGHELRDEANREYLNVTI